LLVFNAGIQGCIAVANNADGEPLIIHDCNTDDLANQDWEVSFFTRENSTPGPIKVFGDKVRVLGSSLPFFSRD
jgi:hypothetical protein